MSIVDLLYIPVNDFLIRHIPELAFILISLMYIFFWRYVFLFLERAFRGLSFSFFENTPTIMKILGFVDSFIIFLVTVVLVIPLIKSMANKYIEPLLDNNYLTIIVIIFFISSYLYYSFVYSRHLKS
ncbi:hypothetical protein HY500_04415 [Candidatus Woesearchaeota archaeon]|nr:hypothetical protein [Candidatus Woesearchaeota archaeon]